MKKINIYDINNCKLEYQCHLNWDNLEQTDKQDVRFCNHCKSDVTFVHNNDELTVASNTGQCVAYIMFSDEYVEKIRNYNEHGGEYPLTAPPVTMGIPKRKV